MAKIRLVDLKKQNKRLFYKIYQAVYRGKIKSYIDQSNYMVVDEQEYEQYSKTHHRGKYGKGANV